MRPDLVIFDCDGVLVDTEPTSNAVLAANLTRHGLKLSTEDCMRMFTGWSMANVEKEALRLGATLPENWMEEIYGEEFDALKKGVPATEGIHEILDRLDALHLPYCVVSNGSEDKMAITLGQNGLLERFMGAIFSAHTLKTSKPDPALFVAALETFRVEPSRAVVIEDSVLGAIGAQRAGISCYGFAPHHDGVDLAAAGASIFKNMRQLVSLLNI
ncbi:HAD family hydrolase [Sneathiella litorea]|uniref:HAD-IA family hydrolase n=1 Tax=Sneathiella litorea TaxID=2606216 RepID=A0A6L8W407_9PROT|nr:HAD family phosphatase [Sneathiella litorea]MZR29801.1 HAD-IA family hydrolase [Sneathiella litorea]